MAKEIYLDADDPRVLEFKEKHRAKEVYLDADDPRVLKFEAEHPKAAYSNSQKAGMTMANGAAFGLFPEGWGQAKGQARGMKEFIKAALLERKLINPMSKEAREKNNKEYSKTKLNVQNAIDEHAKEHPVEAFFEDIAGSVPAAIAMPGGAIARGASFGKKVFHGAKLGGAWGAARGLGENLNAEKGLADTIKNTLISGGFGAGAGAGLSAIVSPFTKTKLEKLEKMIGKNKINESIRKGTPLLEDANERIMQFAQGIKARGNYKAAQRFENYKLNMERGQKDKINKIIDEHISDKNYANMERQIKEEGEKIYKPLYAIADKAGEIPRARTQGSEVIKDFIKKARKPDDKLRKLPDNNIEVLNGAAGALNDEITSLENAGKFNTARPLRALKDNLYEDIDDSVFAHSSARESYSKTKRQVEALERGYKDIPKAEFKDLEIMKPLAGLTEEEALELMRTGAAQHFKNKNLKASSITANLFKSVFGDGELRKMVTKKIISPDQMKKIQEAAYAGEKNFANIHSLGRVSQPAENLTEIGDMNPVRGVVQPKRTGLKLSDRVWEKMRTLSDSRAAKYLTNPKALKYAYQHGNNNGMTIGEIPSRILRVFKKQKGLQTASRYEDKHFGPPLKDVILKMLGEQKGKKKQEEIE